MKRLLILFISVFLVLSLASCSLFGNGGTAVTDKNNLSGQAFYENDKLVKQEFYNPDGSVDHTEEYDENGNVIKRTTSVYDKDGNHASDVVKMYDGDKVIEEHAITYDTNGEVLSDVVTSYKYNEDGSVSITVSNDGEQKSEKVLDKDGSTLYSVSYTNGLSVKSYFENGYITKTETYDENNVLTGYTENTYNSDGSTSKVVSHRADGAVALTSDYIYENGRLAKVVMKKPDGSIYRTNEYSETGRVTMYDANGNVID